MKDTFIDQVHQPHYAHLLYFTLCYISVTDAVVCEPEEVGGTTEENTASVVSSTTEQASEMSSKQGECWKHFY